MPNGKRQILHTSDAKERQANNLNNRVLNCYNLAQYAISGPDSDYTPVSAGSASHTGPSRLEDYTAE